MGIRDRTFHPPALTPGERFWLWRRREDFTQEFLATSLGVSVETIARWEQCGGPTGIGALVSAPTTAEHCVLARRRAGVGTNELARRLGVSRVTLLKWERGEGEWFRLARFWETIRWGSTHGE